MTTKKSTGMPKKRSKKLNLKKETLKDLAPGRGKDARGGGLDCSIPTPYTYACPKLKTDECRTVGACAPTPVPPKIR